MELTRKQVIEELKAILEMQYWNVPLSKAALEYAISSLKTDEAYQIMYEGGEVFTKDEIEKAIGEVEKYICDVETDTVKAQGMAQALDIIEQALRGEGDGNVQLDSKRRTQ